MRTGDAQLGGGPAGTPHPAAYRAAFAARVGAAFADETLQPRAAPHGRAALTTQGLSGDRLSAHLQLARLHGLAWKR